MNDLLAGFAIAIVLEGLLWALAPDFARRMIEEMSSLPERQISLFAWIMVVSGVALFWLARG